MKIAITGGEGFIGKRLTGILSQKGHTVVSVDTAAQTPVDIMDREALINAFAGCDMVYHLAALHSDDVFPRSRYYDVNAKGTKNVIDAAEINDIPKIVFTSTFAIYGLDTGMPDEDSAPQPFNDYGKSKLEAEAHLKLWAKAEEGRSLTIVRPVVVFGEGNKGNVHTLIRQIQQKKFVMVGNGQNKKSMAYVGNVAGFLAHCLLEGEGLQIYNYADKPDLNMEDLTDIVYAKMDLKKPSLRLPEILGLGAGYVFDGIARLTRKNFPISSVRIRKFCANTTCEAERYKQTGFEPEYTLQQGIERMIDHDFIKTDTPTKAA